jgi:hypothetical protein
MPFGSKDLDDLVGNGTIFVGNNDVTPSKPGRRATSLTCTGDVREWHGEGLTTEYTPFACDRGDLSRRLSPEESFTEALSR